MKLRITWTDDNGANSVQVELTDKQFVIGRDLSCDLVLSHSSVSRIHAVIYKTEQGLFLEDQESSYGTLVNHRPVKPLTAATLNPSSEIKLGAQPIRVSLLTADDTFNMDTGEFSSDRIFQQFDQLRTQVQQAIAPLEESTKQALTESFEQLGEQANLWFERNRVLHHINLMLNHAMVSDDLLAQILPMLVGLFGAERGFVLLHKPRLKKLVPSASYSYDSIHQTQDKPQSSQVNQSQLLFSQTVAKRCFDSSEIYITNDVNQTMLLKSADSVQQGQIKSVLAFPLIYAGNVLAVIYLDNCSSFVDFESHREFIKPLQSHLGAALRHAMHYSQAVTDDLTGVYTRRYFEERVKQAMEHSRRYNSTCCLIFLDIDHFKMINDTHGHHVGDLVLMDVANTLQQTARKSDVVGRLGGEEFVLFLSDTALDGAKIYAERIREKIASIQFMHNDENIQLTASLGVAEYNVAYGLAPYQFIEAADQAMYQAKETGRNRVVVAKPQKVAALNNTCYRK
jgi:diguanylate cyclase (GGDEF)-like protein